MKKKSTDHRKVPYRHPDLTVDVTFARQRHGRVRSWVCRQEQHCVPQLVRALRPGTHVFTDMGKWGKIADAGFPLHQVNHSNQYVSPESSTNWCESQNKTLADLEQTHSHISGNYLDFYAAQAAWRGDNTLGSPERRFASMMQAMLGRQRSGMAGYYLPNKKGGTKRHCGIIDDQGERSTWTPLKRVRRFPPDPNRVPTLKEARTEKLWNTGFTFVSAHDFSRDTKLVPWDAGVYAIFVKGGGNLLAESGFAGDPKRRSWTVNSHYRHVYCGESYSLRERLAVHITGSSFDSNLRETLLALGSATGVLSPGADSHMPQSDVEEALTAWLLDNVLIGYKVCGSVLDAEAAMLGWGDSPLNIARREASPFSSLLSRLRVRWRETVMACWKRPESKFTGKRRPRR